MQKISDKDKALWAAATADVAPLSGMNRIFSAQKLQLNQIVSKTIPAIKQESNIDAIDLHNMSLKDANTAVIDWLHNLYLNHAKLALIITGRGRGEETISQEFPRWCRVLPLKNWIAFVEERNKGGAWLVRFKKH